MSDEEDWGGASIAHPDDKYLSRLAKESSVGEKNADKNRLDNARQKDKLSGSFSVGDAAKLKRTDSFPKSLSAEFRFFSSFFHVGFESKKCIRYVLLVIN